MSDDALAGKGDVVGADKELLVRVGVVDEWGAVAGKGGAEVGTIEAGEPEESGWDSGVGAADHFELEVGDDGGEGHGRVREEGVIAEAAELFGAEEGEDDGAARTRAGGEEVGEGEDGGGAGGVIVGAVVDEIGCGVIGIGAGDAEMVEVGGEEDDFFFGRGFGFGHGGVGSGAAEDGDGVPGLLAGCVFEGLESLLDASGQGRGESGLLEIGSVVTAGIEAESLKLGGGEAGGDVLVAGGGTAAVEVVVGEKGYVGADVAIDQREGSGYRMGGWTVEAESRRRDCGEEQKGPGSMQVSSGEHCGDYRVTVDPLP